MMQEARSNRRSKEQQPVVALREQPSARPSMSNEVFTNVAQKVIATAAVLALCYFGKMVLVTILLAVMLAFMLEPLVGWLERHRVIRPIGAMIALLLTAGLLYAASYFSYVKAVDFARDLPKYSGHIRESVLHFRQQAQKVQQARQAIVPDQANDQNTTKVKAVQSDWSTLISSGATVTEIFFAASFIPFLTYFMLSWQEHMRSSVVMLFPRESRTTAYVTVNSIAEMLRSFIVGNVVIGSIM
jgi:predicted PurR-regulated permease PerM